MGILTDFTDFVGLTDSDAAAQAAQAAQFKPYNITTSVGGIQYDPERRMFTSSLGGQYYGLGETLANEALFGYGDDETAQLRQAALNRMTRSTRPTDTWGARQAALAEYGRPDPNAYQQQMFLAGSESPSQNIQRRLLSQAGNIDPQQQLDLYRQMSAPFEEQQRLNLENRLFAQGRLGASAVDRPGGERRSLFDAQAQADLMRQTQAMDWANQQRGALLGQFGGLRADDRAQRAQELGAYGDLARLDMARRQQALGAYGTLEGMSRQAQAQDLGMFGALQGLEQQRQAALLQNMGIIPGMEMGLFNPAMGMGQLGAAGQQASANAMMQGSMNTTNFFGSLIGGGLMGFGAGGGFNNLF